MRGSLPCLLILSFVDSSVIAQAPDMPPIISEQFRQEDPRLAQPVDLKEGPIPIGQLLEGVSLRTGIPLTAGGRDGAGDVSVAVFCRGTPLYKILNGLWSAVSYRHGMWHWDRADDGRGWVYKLTRPRAAQATGPQLRLWVQGRFEANAQRLMDAVEGGEEARKTAIEAVFGRNPEEEAPAHWQGRLWVDILAFKKSLTPEQQISLLRGGPPITLPFTALPSTVRDHLLSQWRVATINNRRIVNGVELPEEPPTTVVFSVRKYETVPGIHLWVTSLPAPPGIGGLALERAYDAYIKGLWITELDSADDPASRRIMKPPTVSHVEPATATQAFQHSPRIVLHVRRLREIAESAETPLVARLPEDDEDAHTWLDPVSEKTLAEYWKQLWRGNVMLKWHDGVQIVSTETWPMEDPAIPLTFLRKLRKAVKPGEFLPLMLLMEAADSLTEKQLRRLKPEFAIMDAVANGRGILALFHRNPGLFQQSLRPEGIPLTPQIGAAIAPFLPPELARLVENGEAKRLAVTITEDKPPYPRSRNVVFWLHGDKGQRLRGFGFTEKPRGENGQKGDSGQDLQDLQDVHR